MSEMSDFFILSKSEKGKKHPLFFPDGKPSGHHLVVLSTYSKKYQQAMSDYANKVLALKLADKDDKNLEIMEKRRALVAHLVADWSFAEPCKYETVLFLLKNAPQLIDEIESAANDLASYTDDVVEEKKNY